MVKYQNISSSNSDIIINKVNISYNEAFTLTYRETLINPYKILKTRTIFSNQILQKFN